MTATTTLPLIVLTGGGSTSGGSGAFPGGAVNSLQYQINGTTFGGISSGTTNGFQLCGFNVTSGVTVAPSCSLPGVPVVLETTSSDTLGYGYRANFLSVSGGTTFALSLPAASGNIAANLPFAIYNGNSGNASLTPTTPNNINALTGQGALSILPKWADFLYQDSASTINWHDLGGGIPTFAAFPVCGDGTHALNFSTSTGIGCQTLTGGTAGYATIDSERNRADAARDR